MNPTKQEDHKSREEIETEKARVEDSRITRVKGSSRSLAMSSQAAFRPTGNPNLRCPEMMITPPIAANGLPCCQPSGKSKDRHEYLRLRQSD